MKGIIGKKLGMTSVFTPDGKQVACTIIEAGPCVVTQVKTKESDGYNSLQTRIWRQERKTHSRCRKESLRQIKYLSQNNLSKNSAIFP